MIASRFGGSTAAYRRPGERGRNTGAGPEHHLDLIRQVRIARRFAVPRASGPEIADFRRSAAAKLARLVEVTPAAPWLGRQRRGVAIEDSAPGQVFAMRAGRTAKVETGTGTYEVRASARPARWARSLWIRRARPSAPRS